MNVCTIFVNMNTNQVVLTMPKYAYIILCIIKALKKNKLVCITLDNKCINNCLSFYFSNDNIKIE